LWQAFSVQDIGNTNERPQALTGGADQIRAQAGIGALHHPVASVKTTDARACPPRSADDFDIFARILVLSAALTLLK
jgi:hypothetical protein